MKIEITDKELFRLCFDVYLKSPTCVNPHAIGEYIDKRIDKLDAPIPVKSNWISVKTKMPQTGVPVLAYHSTNGNMKSNYINDNGDWMIACNGITEDITHWQPLPEPPKTNKK